MVKLNGAFLRKTAQEREMERRVKEKKLELLEYYKAQQRENISSAASTETTPQTRASSREENVSSSPLSRRGGQTETRTEVRQVMNSLQREREKRSYLEEFYEQKVPSVASGRQSKGKRW